MAGVVRVKQDGDARAGGSEEPELDPFEGLIENYPGRCWREVVDGAIDEPDLMNWNEWQAWRESGGGLPKGVRDHDVQEREAEI